MPKATSLGFWRKRSWLEKTTAVIVTLLLVFYALGGPSSVVGLLEFAAVVFGGILAIRYIRGWLTVLMWRLRYRLIVTYVFIGVVPLLLLFTMAALAAYIFYGQVATYLVDTGIKRIRSEISIAAVNAAHDLDTHGGAAEALVRAHLPAVLSDVPVQAGTTVAPPAWLRDEFHGLVDIEGKASLRVAVRTKAGMLVVTAPLDRELLEHVLTDPTAGTIGTARILTGLIEPDSNGGQIHARPDAAGEVRAGALPPADGRFDIPVPGLLTIPQVDWATGKTTPVPLSFFVVSRPSLINARLFSTLGQSSRAPLTVLAIVAALFLLIELVSLFIGIRLTRTMTRAIADLYDGTQRVNRGDFFVRIPVRSQDQLAALAESFNAMTASIRQLIQEQKEKQRLQSELEIAREVQAQLFPERMPALKGLEVAAVCNPARTVSGDYYDFFVSNNERNLAIIVADIAGKGISAALLMASIQSMLRAQFTLFRALKQGGYLRVGALAGGDAGFDDAVHESAYRTAPMITQLNRQLYETIAPGHFATFFCAFCNADTGELTYTNAGHLPPIILRGGEVIRLERGGVVLGIFPGAEYDEETVHLNHGDLLIAFTDGMTEPENSYGEEFGEPRLIEVLKRNADRSPAEIVEAAMNAVREWTSSPEQPDDMTMMVARRH